jgi:hypothetical protein
VEPIRKISSLSHSPETHLGKFAPLNQTQLCTGLLGGLPLSNPGKQPEVRGDRERVPSQRESYVSLLE